MSGKECKSYRRFSENSSSRNQILAWKLSTLIMISKVLVSHDSKNLCECISISHPENATSRFFICHLHAWSSTRAHHPANTKVSTSKVNLEQDSIKCKAPCTQPIWTKVVIVSLFKNFNIMRTLNVKLRKEETMYYFRFILVVVHGALHLWVCSKFHFRSTYFCICWRLSSCTGSGMEVAYKET